MKKLTYYILLFCITIISCGGIERSNPYDPITNNPPGNGTPDVIAPVSGNGGLINAGSITANSLVLNWGSANDAGTAQLNLVYAVYESPNDNINTVYDCESNGILVEGYTTGLLNKTVNGLTASATYYFNVVVRDAAGNKTCYIAKQQTTTAISDTTAPVPGNGSVISAGSATHNSLVLSWAAGTDNMTTQLDLQYAIYQSTSNNISTVSACESATLIQDYSANLVTKNVTGLAASTTYYFNVVVKDSAGNKACYTTKQQATTAISDTTPPTQGNGGTVTTGSVTYNSLVINWAAGTDNITTQLDLQYSVYQSASNSLSTVTDCEAATLIQNYSSNLLTKTATGLAANTTYYFNVVVRDSAGNKACYVAKQQTTTAFSDITAPVQGNSGTITAGSVTHNSLILNWSAGTDNVTSPLDLQYAVYQSSSNSLSTVAECEAATLIQDYTANLLTKTVSGLTASTTYYFNVVLKDSAGNKVCYTTKQQVTTATPDTTAPSAGNSGIITAGSVTLNSLVLNWTAGNDNVTSVSDLQYAVYQSTSNTLATVSGCESATLIQDYSANLLTKNVTGLAASTTYYFNVVVKDSAGNKTCYIVVQQSTTFVPDETAPVPGNSGIITTGSVTGTTIALSWTPGTDNVTTQSNLQYAVYQSMTDTITTVAGCEAATLIQGYTANLVAKNATGLTESTLYYFNVVIRDSAGNKSVYTRKLKATTAITPGLEFTLINGDTEYSVGQGTANTSGSVTVPEYWLGKRVTSISDNGFAGCSMTSVSLPGSITSIGAGAFSSCGALSGLVIPNGVISIGQSTFYGCHSLTSLVIPSGVTVIPNNAFYGCHALTSVSIPNGVTTIGNSAFQGCSSINSLSLPATLTSIGDRAFMSCRGLTSLTIPTSVTFINGNAFGGCTGLTSIVIPNSLTTIGFAWFSGCTGLTSVTIPNTITYIGPQSFYGCTGLTSFTIPSSVTGIGEGAFYGCTGLTSLVIPSSVTSIESYAFTDCSGLTSLVIPNSVTGIGGEATFSGCSGLTSLTLPSSITYIGNYWFQYCSKLTSLTIPSGVKSIYSYAFNGCSSLTSLSIPSGVTSIGYYAFQGCSSLTSLTIPMGITSIGNYVFNGCSGLTSVTIPTSVVTLGASSFAGCIGLSNFVIPSGVTTIGNSAFSGCSGLLSLVIPSGITNIGNSAFSGCSGLTSVTVNPVSPPTAGVTMFNNCTGLLTILVPSGSVSFYMVAPGWDTYSDNIYPQ